MENIVKEVLQEVIEILKDELPGGTECGCDPSEDCLDSGCKDAPVCRASINLGKRLNGLLEKLQA